MPTLTVAALKLEAFAGSNGLSVIVHSDTGMQEIHLTVAEWSRLAGIEITLDAAGRLIAEVQAQRDQAVADVERLDDLHKAEIRRLDQELAKARNEARELRANQAAFAEVSHG